MSELSYNDSHVVKYWFFEHNGSVASSVGVSPVVDGHEGIEISEKQFDSVLARQESELNVKINDLAVELREVAEYVDARKTQLFKKMGLTEAEAKELLGFING